MAVNIAKSIIPMNVDICWYRNDVCPVICSFSEMVQLTSFCIYESMRISTHVHVWFAEK